jgi:hypothetical protein
VVVDFTQDVPELSASAGQRRTAVHTQFSAAHPGTAEGKGWALELAVNADAVGDVGLSRLAWSGGTLTLERGAGAFSASAPCSVQLVYSSPEDFLESILARERAAKP